MGRLSLYGRYGEPVVEAADPNPGGQFRSLRANQSIAAADDFVPEEAMPLFLSEYAEEAEQQDFGEARYGSAIGSRIFRISILVTVAAIAAAICSMPNRFALFENAKASLIGVSASERHASPSAPAVESTAAVQALPPTAIGTPSRDDIAAALRSAHQNQPEMRQPAVATPAATPPVRQIDADELATLLKQAKGFIAIGDIAAARLLLERAADAQDANAALLLAQTYDPAVLGTPDARSITPDPAAARSWYQKAARFGSLDAQQHLAQTQN